MMKRVVLLGAALLTVGAWAQQLVKADQGKPGNQGPWPVTIVGGSGGGSGSSGGAVTGPDGGAVIVQDLNCTAPVESVITFDGGGATPIPLTPLAGRRTIAICSSPKNTGSPFWTIRADGAAPVTTIGTAGQVLGTGDCINYTLAATGADGGNPLHGIADVASAVITSTECK